VADPAILFRILKEWKLTVETGIQLKRTARLNTILYAHNQALTAIFEDELQTAGNHSNKIAKKCNMKISKTRAMRISGNNIQRVKTEVDVKIIE
jgi:hypothetical protein